MVTKLLVSFSIQIDLFSIRIDFLSSKKKD